jgi:integrase-like protein
MASEAGRRTFGWGKPASGGMLLHVNDRPAGARPQAAHADPSLIAGGYCIEDVEVLHTGSPIVPVAVSVALRELPAAGLAAVDDQDEMAGRWSAVPIVHDPLLDAVDLHGTHDFRHTHATWLEDAGIPARVIDELMGHEATSRSRQHQGSAMGAHYRHTAPKMAMRVIDAIVRRLGMQLSGHGDRPLLTVEDRSVPLRRACPGQGRRGRRCSKPGDDGTRSTQDDANPR